MNEQPNRTTGWARSVWQELQRAWWPHSERWPLSHIVMFIRALPLLALWLSIPALMLVSSALWQASAPALELPSRSYARATEEIPDPAGRPLVLEVAYPNKLLLEDPDEAGVSLSVWLLRATATPGGSPGPTPTPLPPVTTTSTFSSTPEPTPTPRSPYVVVFTPSNELAFTDKEGNPVRPEIALNPVQSSITATVLYIRPAMAVGASLPPETQFDISVYGTEGVLNPTPMRIEMGLETVWESRLRRGIGLLTGTTTLITTLVTALVGFGLQQWKNLTEEESNKRQRQQKAIEEIDGLGTLLHSDLSAGTRRYMELKARGGSVWRSGQVQYALQELWNTTAPPELRDALELLGYSQDDAYFFDVAASIGPERSGDALLWARENLDDDWQREALEGIILLTSHPDGDFVKQVVHSETFINSNISRELQNAEYRPWGAILRIWPHVSLWRGLPPLVAPSLARVLRYLGIAENACFGSGKAETDMSLLTCRVSPPWLEDLHEIRTALLTGNPGSGKTATALLLAYDNLQRRDAFPVYYPTTPGNLGITEIAQVLAQTLLRYLAIVPADFLKREVVGRASIAHLLARYVSPNLSLCFHQAGLPSSGRDKVLREIERLTQDCLFQKPLCDDDLLVLLSESRPRGFQYTTILLDVQTQTGNGRGASSDKYLESLLELSDKLARTGVFVKAFLPNTFQERLRQQNDRLMATLDWPEDSLSRLLNNHLRRFGDETLAAWCDPREGELSPDARLVRAAQGTPGRLIRKGNELLQRIGQTQRRLRAQDIYDILGYYPSRCLVNRGVQRLTAQDDDTLRAYSARLDEAEV